MSAATYTSPVSPPRRQRPIGSHIGNSTPRISRHRRWSERPRRNAAPPPESDDDSTSSSENERPTTRGRTRIDFDQYESEDEEEREEEAPLLAQQTAEEILGSESEKDDDDEKSPSPVKKKRSTTGSVAHEYLSKSKRAVLLSIDLEHVGVGIVQLSVVAVDPRSMDVLDIFDQYVKPSAPPETWNSHCMDIHNIRPHQQRVKDADGIQVVWKSFVEFCEKFVDTDDEWGYEKSIMVAWGGQSCDAEWLFKITEDEFKDTLFMPKGMDFFMDP